MRVPTVRVLRNDVVVVINERDFRPGVDVLAPADTVESVPDAAPEATDASATSNTAPASTVTPPTVTRRATAAEIAVREAAARARATDLCTVPELMDRLLGAQFDAPSWNAWRTIHAAIDGLPMSDEQIETFRRLTGRTTPPTLPSTEIWIIASRRGGKSRQMGVRAVHATTCRTYNLAPGEVGVYHCVAADRRQARVLKRYISGLLKSTPALAALVESETTEQITLRNGLVIQISTASYRSIRGTTTIGACFDEIAFFQSEDDASANPDTEILAAIRPSMATIPGAQLVCITSPHARRGETWRMYRQHYGQDESPVLVIQADWRMLNPSLPQAIVDQAYADDPLRAAAEYGAQFRSDVEGFVTVEALDAVIVPDRRELPYVGGERYVAFIDPAGGGGVNADSFTAAVAHRTASGLIVLDGVFERRPPYSPEIVAGEIAAWLKQWHITTAESDRYAGSWPTDAFRKHGVYVKPSEHVKSNLYRELLPIINSGGVELLDQPRLKRQLSQLERRVARSGRESIEHPPGQHDDVANAAAGAIVLARSGGGGGGFVGRTVGA